MGDRIELRGLRLLGHHGALVGEQEAAQPFEIDVEVEADLARAGATDDLRETLDYARLVTIVARVVTVERHRLLERLAERIAADIGADSRVLSVTVSVHKLRPPVPVDMASAGVRITRP